MRHSLLLLLFIGPLLAGCASSSMAQEPTAATAVEGAVDPLPHTPMGDDPPTSVLQGVYTEGQAERGQAVFRSACGACHSQAEFTSTPFLLTWTGQGLGSLFGHIVATMPLENPGRLTPGEYADVVAYILSINQYPKGNNELSSDQAILNGIRFDRLP